MNNPAVEILLKGVLLPILVCAISTLLLSFVPVLLRRCAPALGIAFGYAASHFVLHRPSGLPPGDSLDWLPLVAIIAAAGAILFVLIKPNRFLPFVVFAATLAAGVILPVLPLFTRSPLDTKAAFSVAVGIVLFCAAFFSIGNERKTPWAMLLHLMVVLSGIAVLYMMAGSMLLAGLGGALAATAGVVFFANFIFGLRWNSFSVILPALALEGGLLSYAHNFTSLTATPAVLMLLSFLPGFLIRLRPMDGMITHGSRMKRAASLLMPTAVSAALLIGAGMLVYSASPEYVF